MLRRALVVTAALMAGTVSGARAVERVTEDPKGADTGRATVTASASREPGAPETARGASHRDARKAGMTVGTPGSDAHRGKPSLAPSEDPLNWTSERLEKELRTNAALVGSLSLGRPNAGALLNGVRMPEGEGWEVVDPGRSWGTQETVDYLRAAVAKLRRDFPDAPTVFIGHLSKERGGPLGPHRSHQSGRDVDLSYICKPGMHAWYQRGSARTLDVARSWSLVRALVTETDVEVMFIDLGIQKLLKEHALAIGEDPAWVDSLFRYKSKHSEPLIRHAWGHASHIHARFFNPRAQVLGMRGYDTLAELKLIAPRNQVVRYHARAGDTAEAVAKRAGTNVATIQKFNQGNVGTLEAGKMYLIPVRGRVAEVKDVTVPPRRLPPATALGTAVASRSSGPGMGASRRASPSP